MKKRLLSIIAILALCLALLSVTALAEDTVDYGVTVNDVKVTSANARDVLSDGKVSYNADSNTLTITGGLTNEGRPTATVIQGNGTTDVKIDGGDSTAAFGLTVTDAQNVTVTANSGSPAINGTTEIRCSGNVSITNNNGAAVTGSSFTVTGARDVTVTASSYSSAISGATDITCSSDVNITNSIGAAISGGKLTVNSAKDVTVTASSSQPTIGSSQPTIGSNQPTIGSGADINCSGNVKIINYSNNPAATAVSGSLTVNHAQDVTVTAKGGQAVSSDLTIYDAQNVKVTAHSNLGAIAQNASITCSGDVEIVNEGGGKAVGYTLTFQQSYGHSYTVKTGNNLESLDVYAEKEAGETFNVESLNASAVKIESADHTLGEWEYNSTQHWHSCTVCEAELDRANHTFSGNTCTVCGYSKPVYVPT